MPLCAQLQSSESFEHIGQSSSHPLPFAIMKGVIVISKLLPEEAKGEGAGRGDGCDYSGSRDKI